ncbi:MAG: hypothetical protein ACI90V_007942 [Bacillariaceae sp.]|jgi:hypothetical protein
MAKLFAFKKGRDDRTSSLDKKFDLFCSVLFCSVQFNTSFLLLGHDYLHGSSIILVFTKKNLEGGTFKAG